MASLLNIQLHTCIHTEGIASYMCV